MRSSAKYLLFAGLFLLMVVAVVAIAGDADARTATWDGGGSTNLASEAANWDLDTAPVTNDSVVISTGSKAVTWDLANNSFTSFRATSGYTGIITLTSNLYAIDFVKESGNTLVGATTKWLVIYGNSSFAGTISSDKLCVEFAGNGKTLTGSIAYIFKLKISGDISATSGLSISTATGSSFELSGTFRTTSGISIYKAASGTISGSFIGGTYTIWNYNGALPALTGNLDCNISIASDGGGTARTVIISNDLSIRSMLVRHMGTAIQTLDTKGYNLTMSSTATLGVRGSLKNTGASDSLIICTAFDASISTSVFDGTNIDLIISTGILKMKAADHVESVLCMVSALDLTGIANITSDLSFTGLTASHPYGLYINGTRTSSVTTTSSGTYSLGSGVFAWDNATLKITPVITIDSWERTDGGLRNVVWEGYDYYADHDADATVTWSLVTTGAWLTTDTDGEISGEAEDDATYYYTLTATAANGESASVSGFIIVENSINEGLDVAFSWLSPLIGLMAIGFLAVALSALSGSWTKKK